MLFCATLFCGSTALELQKKTRVEPVRGGFVKDSGEYFGDIKGKGKMYRKTYRLSLKWNRTFCFVLWPEIILLLEVN